MYQLYVYQLYKKGVRFLVGAALAVNALGQGSNGTNTFGRNYHVGFERPESWGLKYFASTTLLSGLKPPEPVEGHKTGSINVGFEIDWLPTLDEGQRRIGFNGTAVQDLNQSPILARPVVRVG